MGIMARIKGIQIMVYLVPELLEAGLVPKGDYSEVSPKG